MQENETVKVFKRKEKKYFLTEPEFVKIHNEIMPYMNVDRYGFGKVKNIYYDTDDFYLINKSIEKPVYKEKFRLRTYGNTTEDSIIFAEIKKKYDGIVYKRRVSGKYSDMIEFMKDEKPLDDNIQIQNEIQWMIKRYNLKPKVYLSYNRLAFRCIDKNDSFRITFDSNIKYRMNNLSFMDESGKTLLDDKQMLMEIKSDKGCPLWMVEILNKYKIYPHSFSKYGECYKDFWREQAC